MSDYSGTMVPITPTHLLTEIFMSSLNNDVLPSSGEEEKIPGQDPLGDVENSDESVAMSDMAMRRNLLGKLIIPPSLP